MCLQLQTHTVTHTVTHTHTHTGNPAVIASTPLLTVRAGGTPNQRASITAFISPPITDNSQITWTFNGSPVLPAAVTELGNEILLPQVVPTSVEGTYTCTVVMGQDTASAVFMVVVAGEPCNSAAHSGAVVYAHYVYTVYYDYLL